MHKIVNYLSTYIVYLSAVVAFVTLEINSDQPVRVHTQNDKSGEKEDKDK